MRDYVPFSSKRLFKHTKYIFFFWLLIDLGLSRVRPRVHSDVPMTSNLSVIPDASEKVASPPQNPGTHKESSTNPKMNLEKASVFEGEFSHSVVSIGLWIFLERKYDPFWSNFGSKLWFPIRLADNPVKLCSLNLKRTDYHVTTRLVSKTPTSML